MIQVDFLTLCRRLCRRQSTLRGVRDREDVAGVSVLCAWQQAATDLMTPRGKRTRYGPRSTWGHRRAADGRGRFAALSLRDRAAARRSAGPYGSVPHDLQLRLEW